MTARATVRPPKPESNIPMGRPSLIDDQGRLPSHDAEYWHNPRCSKSRQGKDLLDAAGSKYTERRYVDDAPSAKELDRVLTALGKEPWEIARMGEDVAKELGLKSMAHDRKKWIDVMVAHPIL